MTRDAVLVWKTTWPSPWPLRAVLSRFGTYPGQPRTKRAPDAKSNAPLQIAEKLWRRGSESNRRIKVLQTSPLPLGYRALN